MNLFGMWLSRKKLNSFIFVIFSIPSPIIFLPFFPIINQESDTSECRICTLDYGALWVHTPLLLCMQKCWPMLNSLNCGSHVQSGPADADPESNTPMHTCGSKRLEMLGPHPVCGNHWGSNPRPHSD